MTSTPDNLSPVDALADRFWEGILRTSPTLASFYGDDRYAGQLEDTTAHGRAVVRDLMERTSAEASAIPTDGLATEDRITRDMLQVIPELAIAITLPSTKSSRRAAARTASVHRAGSARSTAVTK